jgi:hypothetical protein
MVSSQSEDDLVSLLQNLADMDITYKALQVIFTFSVHLFRGPVCLAYVRNDQFVGCSLLQAA